MHGLNIHYMPNIKSYECSGVEADKSIAYRVQAATYKEIAKRKKKGGSKSKYKLVLAGTDGYVVYDGSSENNGKVT